MPIPHGPYDVPLIMADAMFNKDGSLLFSLEDAVRLWGDVILVNGRPWPVMQVERRKYRFRILGAAYPGRGSCRSTPASRWPSSPPMAG